MASKKISYNDLKKNTNNNQLANALLVGKTLVSKNSAFEEIEINSIKEDPKGDFVEIFEFNENAAQTIADSIIAKGYDKTQVIHLCKILEEPDTVERPVRLDGAHRVAAAKIAGIEKIPAYIHTFETRTEALIYAYELQLNRRNLEPYQKLDAMAKLDQLKNPGKKADGKSTGKSAKEIADVIGVSTRTAERMRNIINNADEETQKAVKSKKMSISKADKIINEKKKTKAKQEKFDNKEDDISDSLSYSSGTPQGLNFSHTDGIERPNYTVHSENETDRWLKEKNIQVESAKKEGYAAGLKKGSDLAYEIYEYILSEIEKGKNSEELRNDEKFDDFSAVKIYKAFDFDLEGEN